MLRLFGPTRVDGGSGQRLPRAAFLAVALLDLAPVRVMTREALAARLWEGAPPLKANASLRTLVSRVRAWEQGTGSTVLKVTPFTIGRDETTLPSDLSQFLAIESADGTDGLRQLSELYTGDFLADIEDGSERWIEEQRAWLRDRFIKLALSGVGQATGPAVDQVLRRLAEEAPYDDAVVRAGMVAARQDASQVRGIYDRFAARLRTDLGNEPEAATTELLRELTQGSVRPAVAAVRQPQTSVVASLDGVPRVLILPPVEGGLTQEDRQLADSLVDEVTHTLGRLRTFAVFAPYTARQIVASPFPNSNPYGADYVVSTRFAPGTGFNRLRVALTRLETHELLLSEELAFTRESLAAHHYHLAAALGTRLAEGIERTERHLFEVTDSPTAYVHYLLGCEALRGIDLQSIRRARNHFRDALKLSRDFVAARALLARTHSLEWVLLERNEREPIEKAVALAREAALLDPMDPNAHREIGHALIYLGAVDEAVESLHSAAQLGPHRADVLFHYGDGLVHLGKMREARDVMDKALRLNPLAPDVYHWVSATADYFLCDYASASATLRNMQNPEPAARVIAAVEAMNGNLEEAARYRDMYMAAHPDFRLADYMYPLKPEVRDHYLEGLRRAGFS